MAPVLLQELATLRSESEPTPEHSRAPYLLRGPSAERVNRVLCSDITYVPMAQGLGYLVEIMDCHLRRVPAWRLSNTIDSSACVEAQKEASSHFPAREILNTGQRAPFTADASTRVLRRASIQIGMDGKGRWLDNIFIRPLARRLHASALGQLCHLRRVDPPPSHPRLPESAVTRSQQTR